MNLQKMMSVAALAGFGLSACKMDNPAFGETGASTGEDTALDGSDTQASDSAMSGEVSTTAGDGDGDAGEAEVSTSTSMGDGDGDGESEVSTGVDSGDGDGDGESTANDTGDGDGDGDGDLCQTFYVDAVQDTFLMNGALGDNGGEQSCRLGWTDWGPATQTCAHLNFGGTQEFWIGEQTGGEGVSYYALELDLPGLNQLPTGTIASAKLVMPSWTGEALPAGTSVWVRPFAPGDGSEWEAGSLDGAEPEPTVPVATFKYQRYNTLTWDGANPLTEAPVEIGSKDIGGWIGENSLVIPIDLPTVSSWVLDAVGNVGNGMLVYSNAPQWEFLITSIDGAQEEVYLEVQVCGLVGP